MGGRPLISLAAAVLAAIGLGGCLTGMVTVNVVGLEYNSTYQRAFRDGDRLIVLFELGGDPPASQPRWGALDLAKVRWHPAKQELQTPIARLLSVETSPAPQLATPPLEPVPFHTGLARSDGGPRIEIRLPDGPAASYTLSLATSAAERSVLTLRARPMDDREALVSRVRPPKRESHPWAAVLYPFAIVADVVTTPFLVFGYLFRGR
jgi:hypothetical protein